MLFVLFFLNKTKVKLLQQVVSRHALKRVVAFLYSILLTLLSRTHPMSILDLSFLSYDSTIQLSECSPSVLQSS
ncbi:hypothetical protein EDC96DRAFT_500245 [Choanephora cucurbitarum]|nr:hypothetical protein EDC96DRAFT_500245 [Choanephora cucurbitarum]